MSGSEEISGNAQTPPDAPAPASSAPASSGCESATGVPSEAARGARPSRKGVPPWGEQRRPERDYDTINEDLWITGLQFWG